MAEKQLDLLESTDPVSVQLNYSHPTTVRESVINLPETQDVTGLLMGMYDDEKPASKEDISLLMATLDGIHNNLISITNELSETRQNITKDLQTLRSGNKKKPSNPKKQSLKRENVIPNNSEPPKKKAKLALPKKK
uniref:Uncharacterized protein n=1 Tax=Magallana gigas TaxID=29159 RepID=K1RVL3_MAGGI